MKRFMVIISLVATCAALSASGQGYFQFTAGKSQVWDGFSTGVSHLDSTVNAAILWGPSGDVPLVDGILNGTPSTMTVYSSPFVVSTAWADILSDPNFTLAYDNNTSAMAITRSSSSGYLIYDGGYAFPVTGTTVATTYTMFMIGWDAAYATPFIAAAANTAVGWSQPFQYTATALTATPNPMVGVTPPFGVVGMIPEPTALALAGLGGLSVLLFRRRQ